MQINKMIKKQLEKNSSWTEIKNVIERIAQQGFPVVVAGGAVRDILLKKKPKDIDLATSAKTKELLRILPFAKGEFEKYGVVFVSLKKTKNTLEVTSFRKDSEYKDGRRPSSISYSSMEEDASRRDFTINALFYDPQKEKLIDFTGGLKDLKNKTLRTVGTAKQRFEEDHLRVLRALRLAHQLNFQIEAKTKKAIISFAEKIRTIPKERILNELIQMFSAGRIGSAVQILKKHHVFPFIFPALENLADKQQLKKPYDFWNNNFSFYRDQAFCWTVLALPFFHADTKAFHKFLKSLLIGASQIKKSLAYLKAVQTLTTSQSSFTEKLKAFNGQKKQVFELCFFWLKSQKKDESSLNKILQEFEKREQKGQLPASLVTGSDLLKLFPALPKKNFSFVLKQAFEYQMEHPQAKKFEILKTIKSFTPELRSNVL